MSESYKMPEAEIGEWVLYRPYEGATAVPAMVSVVSQRTLTLWAIAPGYGGNDKFSVHHKDDPGLKEFPEWPSFGTWETRKGQVAILSERLSAAEKRLSDLESRYRSK
jgi:hypothetical protein